MASAALAEEPVASDSVRSGSLRQRVLVDDADLVLFYAAEQEGNLGTCGCEERVLGSMARLKTYVDSSRAANPNTPSLLLNAGSWASNRTGDVGQLTPDALVANEWMIQGSEAAGFDALNASYSDTLWFRTVDVPDLVVSTNGEGAGVGVRYFEAGTQTVAVLGVSRLGMRYLQPEDVVWHDAVQSVADVLPGVRAKADLVVVLAYDVGKQAKGLANLPGVDVLIEASVFRAQEPPWFERGQVWVRANYQTQRVGELRLWIEDGQIVSARDRLVDLDDRIPSNGPLKRLAKQAQRDIDGALRDGG